jgi:hypothetical protein
MHGAKEPGARSPASDWRLGRRRCGLANAILGGLAAAHARHDERWLATTTHTSLNRRSAEYSMSGPDFENFEISIFGSLDFEVSLQF